MTTIDRIEKLVKAGLGVSILSLPSGTIDFHICDHTRRCDETAHVYMRIGEGFVPALLVALSTAEEYLENRDGATERALSVAIAEKE